MILNKHLRFLKRREFWFAVTVYPGLWFASKAIESALMPVATKYPIQYGLITFSISVIIIGCTILEIVSRLMKHELQGEKLKIREREGIHIEEHNV